MPFLVWARSGGFSQSSPSSALLGTLRINVLIYGEKLPFFPAGVLHLSTEGIRWELAWGGSEEMKGRQETELSGRFSCQSEKSQEVGVGKIFA